jgi:hypothetical protein
MMIKELPAAAREGLARYLNDAWPKQEEFAKVSGKSKSWIGQWLRLGRFLNFPRYGGKSRKAVLRHSAEGAEVSDDKSKPVKPPPPAYPYPPTLGEFIRLRWRMQGLCYSCNGTDKFQGDIVAAAKALGEGYSTRDFMLAERCQKCKRRLSLYNWSPEELRNHGRKWWKSS